MGKAALFLAHFQAVGDFARLRAAVQDEIPERRLFGVGLFDILPDPIGDLALGEGILDDGDEWLGGDAGGLEPLAVEALGEILLVIEVEFAGEVQADFIHKTREIDPAAHGFARAARINDFAHAKDNRASARICQL